MSWMTWVQLYLAVGCAIGVLDWMFDILKGSRLDEHVPLFAMIPLWPLVLLVVGLLKFHCWTVDTRGWARRK